MRSGEKGFTLIELLVVMAIIAVLMSVAVPRYFQQTERAREVVLKHNLNVLRGSLDDYLRDNAAFPDSLDALVEKQYLRQLPLDPITDKRNSWVATENVDGKITDVHSGSPLKSTDGTEYAKW
ncbi:type II secretion system protein [Rouxiella badensis]|jgi:general secretion pathway protein G|uniref:Prepilin-type N-terminal cleavage/methylation domain-containing protein n=1 Tax=Rouxiella badensis TaxID=1646377 RepID=A0A1X0W9I4_9GAMM|nr:prepilin-type N-terminal cleavage/methylation domain-containing protein [Rouxiella badensis]MCC3704298.1 type II secretion system GspH family protein [Rouxiella badensis]MCC3720803.1 type II secretion system GspH family protein [Rouxiella badensis]MCC3730642.1 type II secretion system GspH family protein [Rouxiella badensis]MCC3734863.1 type II secretion system GspH family protein [Rouxiella badensis]MCC3741860.1 type II secretion system GspH family protein [Rouxiella badensis]